MIRITTGAPGSGKTLWTVWFVKALSEKEGRPVYYHGIKGLRLPWFYLDDPRKWYEVPTGAIVVIDEAQSVFRPRSAVSGVPDYVAALETHRHRGIDLFLITQHPALIDASVRRLAGEHRHLVRKFGFHWSTIHLFYEVRDAPEKYRKDGVVSQWKFPEEVFSLYESAELHTVRKSVPMRMWFAVVVVPLMVVAFGVFAYSWLQGKKEAVPEVAEQSGSSAVSSVGSSGLAKAVSGGLMGKGSEGMKSFEQLQWEYLQQFRPLVPGLAYTAPVYAKIVNDVVDVPAPVACIQGESRCVCYTGQGTRLPDVSESVCRSIVRDGFFVPWRRDAAAARAPQPASAPKGGGGEVSSYPQ